MVAEVRLVDCKRFVIPRARVGLRGVGVGLLLVLCAPCSRAAGRSDAVLNTAMLLALEHQADAAKPRDRCFLYAEVLQGFTELAGQQMAAGEDNQAAQTMEHVNTVALRLQQATSNDARRLKNAEELMDRTTHRLSDMVRVAGEQQRERMQRTLLRLNTIHAQLLDAVFSK